jgi:pimeloyl-ACP methyl ester carboxylesterase
MSHYLTAEKVAQLRALPCPKMVVGVTLDHLVRSSCAMDLATLLGAECRIFADCGHNVLVEEVEGVAEAIFSNVLRSQAKCR